MRPKWLGIKSKNPAKFREIGPLGPGTRWAYGCEPTAGRTAPRRVATFRCPVYGPTVVFNARAAMRAAAVLPWVWWAISPSSAPHLDGSSSHCGCQPPCRRNGVPPRRVFWSMLLGAAKYGRRRISAPADCGHEFGFLRGGLNAACRGAPAGGLLRTGFCRLEWGDFPRGPSVRSATRVLRQRPAVCFLFRRA